MEPWLVGMQLALLGCFCSAVGLVLLKHSTNVEGGKHFLRKKFWWIGFFFLIVNASVIDVFAFALAPITLIARIYGRPRLSSVMARLDRRAIREGDAGRVGRDVDGHYTRRRDRHLDVRSARVRTSRHDRPLEVFLRSPISSRAAAR